MRLRKHAPLLGSTLKHVALRPLTASQCTRYRYSSTSAAYPERVAVFGGGIAGLSSAHFIAKEFPKTKITIFEGGSETGGWIRSKRVKVPGGDVLFEAGPRALRSSIPTALLIQDLGLTDQLFFTSKTDPGAKNRYIYYPDRLNCMPSKIPTLSEAFALLSSGITAGLTSMVTEPMKPKRSSAVSDETVGSFFARRFDERPVNNLLSAGLHGIYAGDIWQLSCRSLLPQAWQLEKRYGSVLGGFFRMQAEDQESRTIKLAHPYDVEEANTANREIDIELEFAKKLKDASVFSFKDGLQQLVRGMQAELEKKGNVEIRVNSPVQSSKLTEGEAQQVEVISGPKSSPSTEKFDLVVSTLRNTSLTPYVTVMTVNLYFKNPGLLPVEGFGYLIPQSVPFEQNPERALGVIFDSYAVRGQDTAPGTKITIMLGGHWWDGWKAYPTEAEGLEMAKSVVNRHLHITDEPLASHVNLSKDCIPQYTLGYEDRLRDFASELQTEFKGKMRVVGNQFNGVGVNDCITAAWRLASNMKGNGWKSRSCGLDRVQDDRAWVTVSHDQMTYKKQDPTNED